MPPSKPLQSWAPRATRQALAPRRKRCATLFTVTPTNTAKKPVAYMPHPDDLDEVRASSEAAERGEFLSEAETAEMMRDLLDPKQ
jgi:hypothetical protein